MALQHNDELFASTADSPAVASLVVLGDVVATLLQILLSLFKLGIASFLLWLILDLFLLRPVAKSVAG